MSQELATENNDLSIGNETLATNEVSSPGDEATTEEEYKVATSPTPVETETPDAAVPPPQDEWFYNVDVKGEGPRPEWLNDRFNNVFEQAKSYNEARKAMGGFSGAPKDGYSLEKFGETVDSDNAAFKEFDGLAKELKMSQEGYDKIVELYIKDETEKGEKLDKYLTSLNPNEKNQLDVLKQWAVNNFSEAEVNMMDEWANNEEAVVLLKKMRGLSTSGSATPTAPTASPAHTQVEISKLMGDNYEDYKSNKGGFRDKIDAMFAKIV